MDEWTLNVILHSTAIALYVWLDVPGFTGRFTDNGFIMLAADTSVRFQSWTKLGQHLVDRFSRSLTVQSLADVYMHE